MERESQGDFTNFMRMGPRMFHEFAAQSDTPTYKAGHQLPKRSGTEPEAGHHAEVYGKWEQLLPLLGVVRLLLWVARPLLACPLQVESGGYLHTCTFTCPSAATSSASGQSLFALPLPFSGGISSALLCQEVERILILSVFLYAREDRSRDRSKGRATGRDRSQLVALPVVMSYDQSHD